MDNPLYARQHRTYLVGAAYLATAWGASEYRSRGRETAVCYEEQNTAICLAQNA